MKSSKVEKPKFVHEPVETKVTKLVQEPIVQDVQKEVVPSKYVVLKRTKRPAHRPRHSPEPRMVIEYIPDNSISSSKGAFVFLIKGDS